MACLLDCRGSHCWSLPATQSKDYSNPIKVRQSDISLHYIWSQPFHPVDSIFISAYADYSLRYICDCIHFFLYCGLFFRHICDYIRIYSHLQIIFSAKSLTAFAFSSIADYFFHRICDCIHIFPLLQIIFSAKFMTAFAFSSIADYFSAQIIDCIRIFLLLQIIFSTEFVTAFAFSSIADYFPSPSSTVYACCQLTGSEIPCIDRNTREACVMRYRLVSAIKPTV